MRLGTWNVRTLTSGLSDNPQALGDARKTAVISSELSKLNIDITALQETRIPKSGSIREKDYTFVWQVKGVDDAREHGVGFAIRNSLPKWLQRLMTLQLNTHSGPVNLINA